MARRTRKIGGHSGRYTDDELRAMVGESWTRDLERDRKRGRPAAEKAPAQRAAQTRRKPKSAVSSPSPAQAEREAPPPIGRHSPILARISSVSAHHMPASTGHTSRS